MTIKIEDLNMDTEMTAKELAAKQGGWSGYNSPAQALAAQRMLTRRYTTPYSTARYNVNPYSTSRYNVNPYSTRRYSTFSF
ncbi:MAG: hypothetical protein N0E59_12325 [Candidatus Thiodiazotropha taylori]|nr:hypothetical protein [Candidatus Thiodiazotropha taylori]MCG8094190.1 hypothetical protein [Candidatus Thiodiazotropha endolucinida]MCG7968323.1 hypothetical protein [Candidatus Thiodiazotropha taylori]MCG8028102.1 hypothetical protein [Candidatus Thiodiazotropha taylori]MCG8107549.1 hypothetical protein [Candidatus Thiodiazotropha taylori]